MKNLKNKIHLLENELKTAEIKSKQKKFLFETKKITSDKLPYDPSSLSRFIDEETMLTHYNKHYLGYVNKLNQELSHRELKNLDLEHIIRTISKYSKSIRNNAGGAYNHSLFWKMMSPSKQRPQGLILSKINEQFGDFPSFKRVFDKKAKEKFGSGWVWLVLTDRGTLKVITTDNQDNPLMKDVDGGYPLLGLDLWEHAYYLKYKNEKDKYIKNFWSVVNWKYVNEQYVIRSSAKLNDDIISEIVMETNMKIKNNILFREDSKYKEFVKKK